MYVYLCIFTYVYYIYFCIPFISSVNGITVNTATPFDNGIQPKKYHIYTVYILLLFFKIFTFVYLLGKDKYRSEEYILKEERRKEKRKHDRDDDTIRYDRDLHKK